MPKAIQKVLKFILYFENWPVRLLEIVHLLPAKPTKFKLRKGPVFLLRPYSSDISCMQSIVIDGEYFPYFNVMPGDTVIDIGANVGSFSVGAAYREPTARFVAIEPVQKNYELLCKNIELNNLTNVVPINLAVSDKKEKLTIYHGRGSWFASGSFYKIDATRDDDEEEVNCLTLADIFSDYQIDRCDFLKMDCEGSEYKILFGTPDEFWQKIKKIALEFHNFEPDKDQFTIVEFLRSKGYQVVLPKKYERKEIGLIFATR